MSTTKLPEAFEPRTPSDGPKVPSLQQVEDAWRGGYNACLEATGARELWEALQVAMASLRTYGDHPLIEAQARAALSKSNPSNTVG